LGTTIKLTSSASWRGPLAWRQRTTASRGRCSHLYVGPAASGTLNREDWGLTWNLPVDSGGVPVSKDIRIEIELEAVVQQ
jgi:hypothetical protein